MNGINLPDSVQNYLTNGALRGERNESLFQAACQMRDAGKSQHETQSALMCRAVADQLDVEEVNKTIVSVFNRPAREEAAKQNGMSSRRLGRANTKKRTTTYKSAPKGNYKLEKRTLPEPIEDGARVLLKAAFREGENVRIVFAAKDEKSGRVFPSGDGTTLSREWWLKKLDERGGRLDGYEKDRGVYISINPLKMGGSRDQDVEKFRTALCEFDHLDLEEQFHLIVASRIPCTAVMSSGGRSLHAWVKVDAETRAEYDKRVKMLMDHLADHIDTKNKNPSRLSRLPNSKRLNARQELLALNIGAASWEDWESEVHCAAIGTRLDLRRLAAFDTDNDPNNQLGERWICKGGSCLFVAQSGVGKSSLSLQLAMGWAIGRTCFGIRPERPLKSLIIQAENDEGDVAEMFQGSLAALGIKAGDEAFVALENNFVPYTEDINTGEAFGEAARHLIGMHKPDLVWLDPLLSFIGDDVSQQSVCSSFLRGMLNPIAHETGVSWMMVHHTPKPSTDPKSKSGWNTTDHSYAGTGSAELTNWARAVCLLRTTRDEGDYELLLAKRGKRAGATHLEGDRTNLIFLKHSTDSILWEQRPKPIIAVVEPKPKAKRKEAAPKPKPTKEEISAVRSEATSKQIKDFDGLIARITEPMNKKQIQELAEKHGHGSAYLVKKQWSEIESRLVKTNGRCFQKPTK